MKTKDTLAQKSSKQIASTIETILDQCALAFRLTKGERQRLHKSKAAQLIAALPYLAACENAERTALSHVSIYLLSVKDSTRQSFDHTCFDNDEIFARLKPIMNFRGGDQNILNRGMQLLAVQMISGYQRDVVKDSLSKEYNPLVAGEWDGSALIDSLSESIIGVESPQMDGVMTLDDAKCQWWW